MRLVVIGEVLLCKCFRNCRSSIWFATGGIPNLLVRWRHDDASQ